MSTIRGFWVYTIEYLKFQYRDLKDNYGTYEVTRIETYLDQQVTLGRLTRGVWHKRQWLGFLMVQKMVTSFAEHHLMHGALSWDIVILRMLAVVLQCACNARPGDIARSDQYSGKEALLFRDVELTLKENGTTVQDVQAKITMRFVKGYK